MILCVCTKFLIAHIHIAKARLLDTALNYCEAFSDNVDCQFADKTMHLTAMTGTTAVEIGGDTAAQQFYSRKTNDMTINEICDFCQTRMCTIDEISFACCNKDLTLLDGNLKALTECNDCTFGNLPIIFLGDFYQLVDLVNGTAMHAINNSTLWECALTHVIELKGGNRFNQCPTWGAMMKRIREAGSTDQDRKTMNVMVVPKHSMQLEEQFTMKVATFSDKKRARWNQDIFMNCLKMCHSMDENVCVPRSATMIKADMRSGKNVKQVNLSFSLLVSWVGRHVNRK